MYKSKVYLFFFFFQAEDGIRDRDVTGVQTCALPICAGLERSRRGGILSRNLLVFDVESAREKPVPRHRPAGQRHGAQYEEPGAVARRGQDQRLLYLPSAR